MIYPEDCVICGDRKDPDDSYLNCDHEYCRRSIRELLGSRTWNRAAAILLRRSAYRQMPIANYMDKLYKVAQDYWLKNKTLIGISPLDIEPISQQEYP